MRSEILLKILILFLQISVLWLIFVLLKLLFIIAFVWFIKSIMCTSPITIHRKTPSGIKGYTVPCGKCEECRNRLRNEVAALSCLEGNDKGSATFFTLTYSQDHLPIAISDIDDGIRRVVGFQRGSDCLDSQLSSFKEKCNPCLIDSDVFVTPSLFPDDWKAHLKRFRRSLENHNLKVPFSMLCFGEYGSKRQRHLH